MQRSVVSMSLAVVVSLCLFVCPADSVIFGRGQKASFRNESSNATGGNTTGLASNGTANASANATGNTNATVNASANASRPHAEIFNCQMNVARREMSWSRLKKQWCCEHKSVGCKQANVTAKHLHPLANTSAWAAAKVNHSALPKSLMEDTLSEVAMEAAKPSFDDMDCISKDGVITVDEAATFGTMTGVPWGEIKPIFDAIDMNKDHKISRLEFDSAKPVSKALMEDMRAGFQDIDLDGNSLINSEEWLAFCNGWMVPKLTSDVCKNLFAAADATAPSWHRGSIDRTEFEGAGKKGTPAAALLAARRKGRGVVLTLVRSSLRRTHPGISFLGISHE